MLSQCVYTWVGVAISVKSGRDDTDLVSHFIPAAISVARHILKFMNIPYWKRDKKDMHIYAFRMPISQPPSLPDLIESLLPAKRVEPMNNVSTTRPP